MAKLDIKPRLRTIVSVESSFPLMGIDYDKKEFTLINRWWSDKNPGKDLDLGVLGLMSLNEVVDLLNDVPEGLGKNQVPAILKGLYKGGTGGAFLHQGSMFLSWDLDVKNTEKKKENVTLFDGKANSDVFCFLQGISVFAGRSNSGLGMFGYVRVDGIKDLLVGDKKLHHKIGVAVTNKMAELCFEATGIQVEFDPAQSVFRVIRNFPHQKQKVVVNKNHLNFKATVFTEEIITTSGIPALTYSKGFAGHSGTIRSQFNEKNRIEDILPKCGFTHISGHKWQHFSSTSPTTGQVNQDNTFYSYSSTFGVGLYSSFDLVKKAEGLTEKELLDRCKKQGYEDQLIETKEIDVAVEKLNFGYVNPKDIFKICDPLKRLPEKEKYDMIDCLKIGDDAMKYVYAYLEVVPLEIPSQFRIEIGDYLGNYFNEIEKIISKTPRVLISAGTGLGKTTAVVNFLKRQKGKRGIFLGPLQVIVEQVSKENDLPALIGSTSPSLHDEAKNAPLIVATYEQGIKYLADEKQHFDYIVVDEFHNLILGQNYKQNVLRQLYQLIKKTTVKVIGLSGTISTALSLLDFTIISVVKKDQKLTPVIRRTANKSGHNTVINHVREFEGRRFIFRLNNTNDLGSIEAQLIEEGMFKPDEILVLRSSKQIKEGKDFRNLVENGKIDKRIKVVLTTSIIDEGLSIRDASFDHAVFIECNTFTPRPEPIAQNFARIREPGPDMKYFLYLKVVSKKDKDYFDEIDNFNSALDLLKKNKPDSRSSQPNHLLSNSEYYLEDGSINKPRLGYDISQQAFEKYTSYMLDRCLKNYNLDVVLDESFVEISSDSEFKKAHDKSRNIAIHHVWTQEWPTICYIVGTSSQDPDLRHEDDYDLIECNEECAPFIYKNLPTFEKYFKLQMKIRDLGVNPNDYIVKDDSLATVKELNNHVFALSTKSIIEAPRTRDDFKAKAKLEAAINCLIDMESCTKEEVVEAFDDGIVFNRPSVEVAVKVLKEYSEVTYNKRSKLYRVKKRAKMVEGNKPDISKDPDDIDIIF